MSLWRSVQSILISEGYKKFIRPCVNWCEQHMGKSRNDRSRWGKFGSCPYQLNLDTPKSCENVEGVSKHHEHSFGLTLNVGYQGGLRYRVKKTPQLVIQLASGIPESYCFGVITKRVGWGAWEWHPPPSKYVAWWLMILSTGLNVLQPLCKWYVYRKFIGIQEWGLHQSRRYYFDFGYGGFTTPINVLPEMESTIQTYVWGNFVNRAIFCVAV